MFLQGAIMRVLSFFGLCFLMLGCSSKQSSKTNIPIIMNSECHSAIFQGSCRDKNGNLIDLGSDKK